LREEQKREATKQDESEENSKTSVEEGSFRDTVRKEEGVPMGGRREISHLSAFKATEAD